MSRCTACKRDTAADDALQCPRCRSGLRENVDSTATVVTTATIAPERTVHGQDVFIAWLREQGAPEPVAEYRFDSRRKWRFDYAWPDKRVALEVEGGAFSQGRHVRGKGFRADCEKYNTATAAGWRLLRVLPSQLCTLDTLLLIRRTIAA